MDFEQQIRQLFFADDITRVRKQLKDNLVLFKNPTFTKVFLEHLASLIKNKKDSQNILQQVNDKKFDSISANIYQYFKEYLNDKKFEVNVILIYIIEVVYTTMRKNIACDHTELNNFWEIISPEFKPNSTSDNIFQKIDERIIEFNKAELLFVYTLRQMPINDIKEFLKYHRKNSKIDYDYFLKYILLEYEPLLSEKTRKVVNDYLESVIGMIEEPIIEKNITSEFTEIKFPESNPQADHLLNVEQAAKFLNLAVPTLYTKTSTNSIPFRKRGKHLYFLESELRTWLDAGKRKSKSELDAEAELYISQKKALR